LIFGTGGGFFAAANNPTKDSTEKFISLLPGYGITQIDTAAVYPGGKSGQSETLLGQIHAPEKFILDTKIMVNGGHAPGAGSGDLNRENVLKSFKISCERLGVEKVRTLYCHRPDPGTPLEETAAVFDELYKQGKFEHWGVSNYQASTLKELLAVCEKKGFVKPTVYQGMYNVLCRHADKKLFPILKDHGIAYNVYSPTAGGLFSAKQSSRYTPGSPAAVNWIKMYKENPKMGDAVEKIFKIADENGISAIELALRWVVHNSPLKKGDGVILGARNEEQLKENVGAIGKGKLPEKVVKELDGIWEGVQDVAPGDL